MSLKTHGFHVAAARRMIEQVFMDISVPPAHVAASLDALRQEINSDLEALALAKGVEIGARND